jgi:hypothetical protein
MQSKRYSVKQRAIYRVAAMLGIQIYRLREDGSIQPGLFYTGWKLRVQRILSRLLWPTRGGRHPALSR